MQVCLINFLYSTMKVNEPSPMVITILYVYIKRDRYINENIFLIWMPGSNILLAISLLLNVE